MLIVSQKFEDEGFIHDQSGRVFWGSRGSGCLLVREHPELGKQFLLTKRSPHVEQPGTWGVTGGAVPRGEKDEFQSALRETQEEIGHIPAFTVLDSYLWKAPGGTFTFRTYILEIEDYNWTPKAFNWEVTQAKWVTPEEAQKLNLHFGVKDLIKDKALDNAYIEPDFDKTRFDKLDQLKQRISGALRNKVMSPDEALSEFFRELNNIPATYINRNTYRSNIYSYLSNFMEDPIALANAIDDLDADMTMKDRTASWLSNIKTASDENLPRVIVAKWDGSELSVLIGDKMYRYDATPSDYATVEKYLRSGWKGKALQYLRNHCKLKE